jgi:hypothetical protein
MAIVDTRMPDKASRLLELLRIIRMNGWFGAGGSKFDVDEVIDILRGRNEG